MAALTVAMVAPAACLAHGDNVLVFSTEDGGGTLVTSGYHLAHQKVDTSCALDLEGECVFYGTAVPGFDAPSSDVPEGRFSLDGATLSLEIVTIHPAVALKIGETTLAADGQSAVLGPTPDLHTHAEWRLVPEGAIGDFPVQLRFTAPGYEPSEVLTATVTNTGVPHGECGDPTGDGRITEADFVEILRAGVFLTSTCHWHSCDVNQDGEIDDVDGVRLLRRMDALSTDLECPEHD
jgi:hypothetical protein